jgi:uncharacterized peroxidase-related enzyme
MPNINLPDGLPGIVAGFNFRPETAAPMRELANILLHERNTLSAGERELIAAYVSSRNRTTFCELSHGAAATAHLGDPMVVEKVKVDFRDAPIRPKLKALIAIAAKVQQDGKLVTALDIERAHQQGATDMEIHDTILIAAAFCMYNRYVDGLGAWQPRDPGMYTQMGRHLADEGYLTSARREPLTAA